jgi:LDH2 family malate/lactate/ureidoglycolate dehydrogenase
MAPTPATDRPFKSSDLEAFVTRALVAVELPRSNTGQVIVALDVARFSPVGAFKRKVDEFIRDFRNSKRMSGVDRIRLPGEQSHATWLERSALGIPMNDALFNDLQRLAAELGIEGLTEP